MLCRCNNTPMSWIWWYLSWSLANRCYSKKIHEALRCIDYQQYNMVRKYDFCIPSVLEICAVTMMTQWYLHCKLIGTQMWHRWWQIYELYILRVHLIIDILSKYDKCADIPLEAEWNIHVIKCVIPILLLDAGISLEAEWNIYVIKCSMLYHTNFRQTKLLLKHVDDGVLLVVRFHVWFARWRPLLWPQE